jgi:hypothetical protein
MFAMHGLDFFDARGSCEGSSWNGPPSNQENAGWLEASAREISTKSNLLKVRLFVYNFDSIWIFCTSTDGVSRPADNLLQQICQHIARLLPVLDISPFACILFNLHILL